MKGIVDTIDEADFDHDESNEDEDLYTEITYDVDSAYKYGLRNPEFPQDWYFTLWEENLKIFGLYISMILKILRKRKDLLWWKQMTF